MTTESRERAEGFRQAEKKNHHWYNCQLCPKEHLVDDDADVFRCPNVPEHKPDVILFHPNE